MDADKFIEFDRVINSIRIDSERLSKAYGAGDNELEYNLIDINKFIKVLYTLLDMNGLLLNPDKVDGIDANIAIGQKLEINKFFFTEEYPDEKTGDRNIVSFEIIKRVPASLASGASPFEGTKQWRPMLRKVIDNNIEGVKEAELMTMMDNRIRFTCWSTKVQQAHKLARLMEQFIAKYYWFLRQFAPVIVFEGQNIQSRATDAYGSLRYYPIYLDYFIRTAEVYSLSENEVKVINLNINRIKTVISEIG
jgi:hypothetical protein